MEETLTRSYELVFIADPRMPDEEVVALTDDYKDMLTSAGAVVTKEESWGRRRLAYPIQKLNEGKYVVLYIEANGVNPFPPVEQRMRQNDKVLRFLTVRTDEDLKRAASKGKKPPAITMAVRLIARAGSAKRRWTVMFQSCVSSWMVRALCRKWMAKSMERPSVNALSTATGMS